MVTFAALGAAAWMAVGAHPQQEHAQQDRVRPTSAGQTAARPVQAPGAPAFPAASADANSAATPTPLPIFPEGTNTALGAQIAGLLADPRVAGAHWGVAVTALDGTPIFGLEEGKLFRPASTAKLFTTAAALAMLGADRRFTTSVVAEGELGSGVLHGDVILRGGGDANFAGGYRLPYQPPGASGSVTDSAAAAPKPDPLADIDALAEQVAATGLKRITGDVVGDDTRFENTPYAEGWSTEDLLWGYGAPVSALTVHDNQVELAITAGPTPSSRATFRFTPALPYYTVEAPANLSLVSSFTVYSQDFGRNQVRIDREPGSHSLHVVGDVAAKYGPEREEIAIDEPARYAATALRAALLKRGITVGGAVRTRHWDSGYVGSFLDPAFNPGFFAQRRPDTYFGLGDLLCEAESIVGPAKHRLAEHRSAPLAEDLRLTLKTSQNLHAEIMLRNLAVAKDCGGSLRSGVQILRLYLIYAGLEGHDLQFYDGSGLSTKDLVTPRAEAQLLAYATRQPWFAAWKAALPVGGVDGTLAGRFKEPPLKGHVFAKTGTLGESRALAGYVDCASGKTVIFSIMVDNHLPGSGADRDAMDRVVAAIAATQ